MIKFRDPCYICHLVQSCHELTFAVISDASFEVTGKCCCSCLNENKFIYS